MVLTRRMEKRMTARGAVLLAIFVTLLGGCGRERVPSQAERPVISEYKGWQIAVTPSFSYATKRWRARVEVWPPERRPEAHTGVRVHFPDGGSDRRAVEEAGTVAARRYIDASRAVHQ